MSELKIYPNEKEFKKRKDKTVNGVTQKWLDKNKLTLEQVQAKLLYCIGCFNCFNCTLCFNCKYCQHCKHCDKCTRCENCNRCGDCIACKYCTSCDECTDCDEHFGVENRSDTHIKSLRQTYKEK